MDGELKKARYHPDTEKLLRQFLRYESGVDTKAFNLRHIYMEQCSNESCKPHLTDEERAEANELLLRMDLESAVLSVLGRRGSGT